VESSGASTFSSLPFSSFSHKSPLLQIIYVSLISSRGEGGEGREEEKGKARERKRTRETERERERERESNYLLYLKKFASHR
jgi:hypothetical protein